MRVQLTEYTSTKTSHLYKYILWSYTSIIARIEHFRGERVQWPSDDVDLNDSNPTFKRAKLLHFRVHLGASATVPAVPGATSQARQNSVCVARAIKKKAIDCEKNWIVCDSAALQNKPEMEAYITDVQSSKE